ncbi:MAG: hypothetical protein JSW70_02065 [Syntrophobacterales bacterium]|nr:MAG: hypothetical protein JSW70_02065 [Syntrophobacterales bacterium]
MSEIKGRISRAFHLFVKKRGREPLPEEITPEVGMDPIKIQRVIAVTQEAVSLETPLGDDTKLEDFIENREALSSIRDLIERMDLARTTRALLSQLKPRKERILRLRCGIGEPRTYTLAEVGRGFGLSQERIRQIQRKALEKLKARPGAATIYGESLRGNLNHFHPSYTAEDYSNYRSDRKRLR